MISSSSVYFIIPSCQVVKLLFLQFSSGNKMNTTGSPLAGAELHQSIKLSHSQFSPGLLFSSAKLTFLRQGMAAHSGRGVKHLMLCVCFHRQCTGKLNAYEQPRPNNNQFHQERHSHPDLMWSLCLC